MIELGQTVGNYRITAKIGEGGMGEVHLAQDTILERRVALKLLPAAFIPYRDRVRRFEQEAQALRPICWPPSSQWVASSGCFHNSP